MPLRRPVTAGVWALTAALSLALLWLTGCAELGQELAKRPGPTAAAKAPVLDLAQPRLRAEFPAGSRLQPGGPTRPGLLVQAWLPPDGRLLTVEARAWPEPAPAPALDEAWAQAEQERLARLLPRTRGWSRQARALAGRPGWRLSYLSDQGVCQRLYIPAEDWLYVVSLLEPPGRPPSDLGAWLDTWQLAPPAQPPAEAKPAEAAAAPEPAPAAPAKPLSQRQQLYSLDPATLAKLVEEIAQRLPESANDPALVSMLVEAKAWLGLALARQAAPPPPENWGRLRARAVSSYRRLPRSADARRALGLAMIMEKRLEKAHTYLEAARELDPAQGANCLALAMLADLTPAARAEWAQAAVAAAPDLPGAHLALAGALEEQNQAPAARPQYAQALALQPDNLPGLLGLARLEMDDPKTRAQAAARLRRVLELMPSHAAARFNLALVLLAQNQAAQAMPLIEALLEQDAQDATVLNLKGQALLQQGQPLPASQAFEAATQADPDHAQAFYNLGGVCANQLKNHDCARQAFARFLELEPRGPRADKVRAWLLRPGG
ncbi:MAG: tetratricopeptide repeat protein [Pseudomonadota bacterium]